MKKTLTALALASGMLASGAFAAPVKPTVVLVHGAFADASSWNGVTRILEKDGYSVIAAANPLRGVASDGAYIGNIVGSVKGPVVLVGHSYGGNVISAAASDRPNVKALVYVAAFAPDAGQSTGDQVAAHPAPPGLGGVTPFGDGYLKMSVESWINNVAQDLAEEDARVLATVQTPLGLSTFSDKVSTPAWADRPSWYIVSRDDRAVSVELQRALASRLKARTTELSSSHMSLLSLPRAVAEIIGDAVNEVSTA